MEEFKPDVIYSQLSTLELIRQVGEVHEITGKPVVIHMMDDWPRTINRRGLFGYYWKRIIDSEFRGLLNKSALLMSIGDAMSEEYLQRYGREFVPFHNPIETNNWIPNSKTDYSLKGKFTILYAGRIGVAVKNSVRDIAMAVTSLAGKGHSLVFEIQTNDVAMLKSTVDLNEHVRWMKPIGYHELPGKFSAADLLVLPHDFDRSSIDFLRLSFSTKVTEYMISGTPVLVYADKETALARGAMKTKWAYVVTEESPMALEKAILELMGSQELRKTYGERAKKLAAENEDASLVREKFRSCFRDLTGTGAK
jgi:glycosyltransferase involved in cell wall biosynthesis